MIEIQVGACTIRVFEFYMETLFPNGAFHIAVPGHNASEIIQAYDLGYEGDTRVMTLDHELAHTWLAVEAGYPFSQTLFRLAGFLPEMSIEQMTYEEARVQDFLRALDKHQIRPWFASRMVP